MLFQYKKVLIYLLNFNRSFNNIVRLITFINKFLAKL
jgi:hypothetical protein